jgi:hypothetical protein
VRRPEILTSNIDNAIDGLINPSASINNTTHNHKSERWKHREPRAEKGSNHANSPLKYWVELHNRYPNLSKLALDVFSIPASSCEYECLFSELGDLLKPCYRAIKQQLLAVIQCVRRWKSAGLGKVEVAAKLTMTDNVMELLYNLSSWGGNYYKTQHQELL